MKRKGNWIQTYSGIHFYPLDPRVEDICIEDIAHALSNLCRFTGHSKGFYSVAQHSVYASRLCPKYKLWALLHDASEAYLGDVSSPLKHMGCMLGYRKVEANVMRVICEKFNLPTEEPEAVKYVDQILVATEAQSFMGSIDMWNLKQPALRRKFYAWSPRKAEELFLEQFKELVRA